MIDFFISYASADEEWARAIDRWLNEWGYQTWLAARDERARWGPEVERALASSQRLLAVLSPAYDASKWCDREWRTIAARDPEGANDLVVVVRIAGSRREGPLDSFHWVDGIAAPREVVRHRLEQRVRRTESGDPWFQPTVTAQVHDTDTATLRSVKETVARWREQFGPRQEAAVEAMRDSVTRWREQKEPFSDEALSEAVEAARGIAAALRDLPVRRMAPALRFGLRANPMLVQHEIYLDVGLPSRDDYALECLNRVFNAALEIARFDDSHMPRGLADVPNDRLDVPLNAPIFLLTTSHRGEPCVFTLDPELRWAGTLRARAHGASLLCASRDTQGLHAVANDDEELVVWSASQVLPATIVRHPTRVIAATMWGATALIVDTAGRVFTIAPHGKGAEYPWRSPSGRDWETGAVHLAGTDLGDAWVALADRDVLSHGTSSAERGRVPVRELAARSGVESPSPGLFGPSVRALQLGYVAGRPALLIEWRFGPMTKAAFSVHSPDDLRLLHSAIPFGSVAGASLVAGRYLVASRLSAGKAQNCLATFDLASPSVKPAAEAAFGRYEAYGFHDLPGPGPARCIFALRDFEAASSQQYLLATLEFAAGIVRSHGAFPDLRLAAATDSETLRSWTTVP